MNNTHVMRSTALNHGESQCINCKATNREIDLALGPVCPNAPAAPSMTDLAKALVDLNLDNWTPELTINAVRWLADNRPAIIAAVTAQAEHDKVLAKRDGLREAATALRDDMLMRAELDRDGDKLVNAGAGVWFNFCNALTTLEAES